MRIRRNESSEDEIFVRNLTPEEEPQVEITVGGQEVLTSWPPTVIST